MNRLIGLGTALALFGCSAETPEREEATIAEQAEPAIAEPFAQPLTPFEGEAELSPLAADAAKTAGLGEGGCRFAYMYRPLLMTGDGKAVAVLGGRALTLSGEGIEFAAEGTSFRVERAEGSPEAVEGGEQWPADLIVTGSQGEAKFSPGTWTCAS